MRHAAGVFVRGRARGSTAAVELHKEDTLGRNGLCQPRASSVELLASGKFVISGRAASCNKPSTKNGGINLHSEVAPQSISKISSRLAQ